MNGPFSQAKILFVDDEEKARKYFSMEFSESFDILLAENAQEGYELFVNNADTISIVVADQRMPGKTGTAFLTDVFKLRPEVIRILSTAYADIDAAVEAVNDGRIYHYVSKPWDVNSLRVLLCRAYEHYLIDNEYSRIVEQKISRLHDLLVADRILLMSFLVAERNRSLKNANNAIRCLVSICSPFLKRVRGESSFPSTGELWRTFYLESKRRFEDAFSDLSKQLEQGQLKANGDSPSEFSLRQLSEELPHVELIEFANTDKVSHSSSLARTKLALETLIWSLSRLIGVNSFVTHQICESDRKGFMFVVNGDFIRFNMVDLFIGGQETAAHEAAAQLVTAIFGAYDAGWRIELEPNAKDTLLVTLDPSGGDSIDSVILELISNDPFWLSLFDQ